jgi:hypothetical protein
VVLDVSSATRQLIFNKQTPRTGLTTGLINAGMLPNRYTTQGAFQDAAEGVTAIFQDTVRRQSRDDVCIKSNQALQLFDLVDRLFSFV